MELLNPAGLWWLAALPLLFLPYLLRERPRPRTVPALFLYQGIETARRLRLFGAPRLERLFWLQLLLFALAVVALARPAFRGTTVRSALVLDTSASMQAASRSGSTRFEHARRVAASLLEGGSALWDVYELGPSPRTLGLGASPREAAGLVRDLEPTDRPDPAPAALGAFFERLARRGYADVHVVTDRKPPAARSAPWRVTTVGEPLGNVGLTAFTSYSPGPDRVTTNVTVSNFSSARATTRLVIEEAESGVRTAPRTVEVPPGGSTTVSQEVGEGSAFRAAIESDDGFPLDDQAFATAAPPRERSVLLVSPVGSGGLDRVAPRLVFRLEVLEPRSFTDESAAGRDLVIFHRSAPLEAPPAPALYVIPPDAPFLPKVARSVAAPELAFALPTHPALRYLNALTIKPRRAFVFRETRGWQPLVLAAGGAVVSARAGESASVVVGFDLLPFLGERNRPASILTLNVLSWLFGEKRTTRGSRLGLLDPAESNLSVTREIEVPRVEAAAPAEEIITRPLWRWLLYLATALLLLEALLRGGRILAPPPALALRIVVLALLAASALDLSWPAPGASRAPLLLMDVSSSVSAEARARAVARLRTIAGPEATATVFAARPVETTLAGIGDAAGGGGETDLESALAHAAMNASEGAAVVLSTDGWETRGDARRALVSLRERAVRVYVDPVEQAAPPNVEAVRLGLPLRGEAGRPARAEVVLENRNSVPVPGRIVFRRGGRVLASQAVRLAPGANAVTRDVLIDGSGLLEFSAAFESDERERNRLREDDVAKAWVAASERERILVIGASERQNRYVEQALEKRGFPVTSAGPREIGLGLERFGAVVLNDVPAAALPKAFLPAVRDYVAGGGGFVMTGGPQSFGLGGYRGTPVEEVLPVRMKEPQRDEPRLAVVLVIDKSGSMREEDRMIYAKEAARELLDRLNDRDRLAVIGFDREAFVVVPLREVADIREDFAHRVGRLRPVGGTRLYPALIEAQRELDVAGARRRHIIVLSDGLSEDATTAAGMRRYYDLALALSETGVTITTIALGGSADANFLERLASYGRGAFHLTLDPSTLPEIVLGEFEGSAREKTLREEAIRALPAEDSALVGEIARSEPRWPPVAGLVETELKRGARLDVGARIEGEPPLVASWSYEGGRAVAFTTDAYGRWSDRWVRWDEWSRLWAKVAEWLLPEGQKERAGFAAAYRDGQLVVEYTRYDTDPPGPITAAISGPQRVSAFAAMNREAPGHYRGILPTRAPGEYEIEIRGPGGPLSRPPLRFAVPPSAALEFPRAEPNWPLLEEIARETGGRLNPKLEEIESRPAPGEAAPLAPYLIPLAIVLFVTELVARRMSQREPVAEPELAAA